jgi:hypothetical protein
LLETITALQPIITTVGLLCDIAGFGLLAADVFAALHSGAQLSRAVGGLQRLTGRTFLGGPRTAMDREMEEQWAQEHESRVTKDTLFRTSRAKWGIALVVLGFGLQIVAQVPGVVDIFWMR